MNTLNIKGLMCGRRVSLALLDLLVARAGMASAAEPSSRILELGEVLVQGTRTTKPVQRPIMRFTTAGEQ